MKHTRDFILSVHVFIFINIIDISKDNLNFVEIKI